MLLVFTKIAERKAATKVTVGLLFLKHVPKAQQLKTIKPLFAPTNIYHLLILL
jgi:hypothetical protein